MDDEHLEPRPVLLPGIDLTLWALIVVYLLVGAGVVSTAVVLLTR
jgi:hypothetical protein